MIESLSLDGRRGRLRPGRCPPIRLVAILLFAVFTVALPGNVRAQTWSGWNLYWENDTFVPDRYRSDARYTNGIRYVLIRDPEKAWDLSKNLMQRMKDILLDARLMMDAPHTDTPVLVLGQNFFTPSLITSFDEDPTDRPFAGFLYAGFRVDITQEPPDGNGWTARGQHSFELDGGILGPPALAEPVQKGVHLLRKSRIPKGWDHQLSAEPAVQALFTSRWSIRYGIVDLVPHYELSLGSVQTFGSFGFTLRLGNIRSFPSLLNAWTAAPRETDNESWFQLAFLAGIEGRGYLRNAYVDGALFGDSLAITPDHTIVESRLGAMVRLGSWSANYSFVHRDSEFDAPAKLGDGDHYFGSFTIGQDLRRNADLPEWLKECECLLKAVEWLKKDWLVEVSLGHGVSRQRLATAGGSRQGGVAMRVGGSKRVWKQVFVGVQQTGVLDEGGPPDPDGWHEDTFYVNTAWTLGWRQSVGRFGQLILRGGWGSAQAKVERTKGGVREIARSDSGRALLLGITHGIPLGKRTSLAIAGALSELRFEPGPGPAQSFFVAGLGVHWHP